MTELTLTRTVPHTPTETWTMWTEPETFNSWFWPERLAPVTTIDARQDGRWRIESPVAEMGVEGEYSVVDEPTALRFTWHWDGEDEVTQVAVGFAAVDGGTEVTVQHQGFTSDEDQQRHVEGWTHCLDRLPS